MTACDGHPRYIGVVAADLKPCLRRDHRHERLRVGIPFTKSDVSGPKTDQSVKLQ